MKKKYACWAISKDDPEGTINEHMAFKSYSSSEYNDHGWLIEVDDLDEIWKAGEIRFRRREIIEVMFIEAE